VVLASGAAAVDIDSSVHGYSFDADRFDPPPVGKEKVKSPIESVIRSSEVRYGRGARPVGNSPGGARPTSSSRSRCKFGKVVCKSRVPPLVGTVKYFGLDRTRVDVTRSCDYDAISAARGRDDRVSRRTAIHPASGLTVPRTPARGNLL